MAKSQRKPMKALNARAERIVPLHARLAAEVYVPFDVEKAAWEIVAEIMAHFGAGYAAQRQLESRERVPDNSAIFKDTTVAPNFETLLHKSTVDHFPDVKWYDDGDGKRKNTLNAAFQHGVVCRQKVVKDGTGALTLVQILETLPFIQQTFCPPGPGGGAPCSF